MNLWIFFIEYHDKEAEEITYYQTKSLQNQG